MKKVKSSAKQFDYFSTNIFLTFIRRKLNPIKLNVFKNYIFYMIYIQKFRIRTFVILPKQ